MTHDLIIIGAGPAGMSAAITGKRLGIKTAIIDEQRRVGGQIYRNVANVDPDIAALLGPDYRKGRRLAEELKASGAEAYLGSTVWDVGKDLRVTLLSDGITRQLRGAQIIVATGAMERASPIPGWTLPGVLNAGAAQIALKSAGSVPSGSVAIAGCGPLLLLVACQLLDAGVTISAVVETAPASNRIKALPHLPAALLTPSYLLKGVRMLRRLRRASVPWFQQAEQLAVEGNGRAEALCFTVRGRPHRVAADVVLLHHGVVPNTQMSRLLRLDHEWSDTQLAWHPRVDIWGKTSLNGFRIAGDGAAIAGAVAAEASGILAAIGAAHELGKISLAERGRLAAKPLAILRAERRIRPFLDMLYRPPEWIVVPDDATTICRCEEVTAGDIRKMVKLGCRGPNQTKSFSRCGMGPCQGRICGLGVTQILAKEWNEEPSSIGAYRIRAPLKPVPISAIAVMKDQIPAQ